MTPSRPRRPALRAERRARKRARILSAARALLRDHGHERLSLRHVARRARMSPAGMYEFFDHREHLIDTLAAEANSALVAALRAAAVDTPDAVARLVRVGLAYIRFAEEHPTDFMRLSGRRSTRLASTATPASSASNAWPSAKVTTAPTAPTMRVTAGDSTVSTTPSARSRGQQPAWQAAQSS